MGVLSLQLTEGQSAATLGITGEEIVDITGVTAPADSSPNTVHVKTGDVQFDAVVRIDSPDGAAYHRHGGIMP